MAKSQVSLFIILGLMIVVVAAFIWSSRSFESDYRDIRLMEKQARVTIESCLSLWQSRA